MSSNGNENRELRTGWKRHTGVLEGTPSSEATLRDAHGKRMRDRLPAMRYFSRTQFAGREGHVKEGRRFAGQPYAGPACPPSVRKLLLLVDLQGRRRKTTSGRITQWP